MRLGQLARKLDKKPQELLDFLEKEHQILLEMDLNTKVGAEALDLLMKAFKEEVSVESLTEDLPKATIEENDSKAINEIIEEPEEEIELSVEEIEDIAAKSVIAEIDENAENVFQHDDLSENGTVEEEIERISRIGEDGEELPDLIIEDGIIKAPKPELDGPTVVGKIELPSIKRSVQFLVTNGNTTTDVTETVYEKRKADKDARKQKAYENRKKRKAKQTKKRPRKVITDADRKAFEEKRRQRKSAELKKYQAEKRKKHYTENVQQKVATQSKKKKKKEIEKAIKKQKAPKLPEPTTAWGRFKRWLNT